MAHLKQTVLFGCASVSALTSPCVIFRPLRFKPTEFHRATIPLTTGVDIELPENPPYRPLGRIPADFVHRLSEPTNDVGPTTISFGSRSFCFRPPPNDHVSLGLPAISRENHAGASSVMDQLPTTIARSEIPGVM